MSTLSGLQVTIDCSGISGASFGKTQMSDVQSPSGNRISCARAHRLAADNKQAIEEFVYQLALEAHADNPKLLAQELCLVMEGAYVTRHVTGNPQTTNIARGIFDRLISARSR